MDSQGQKRNPGAQGCDGCGLVHRCAGILRLFSPRFGFLRRLADDDGNRTGHRQFRSLGLYPNSRGTTGRGTVGGFEERFLEPGWSDLPRAYWFYRRLDRSFPASDRNHGGSLSSGGDLMGFCYRGPSTGRLETGLRGIAPLTASMSPAFTPIKEEKSWQR